MPASESMPTYVDGAFLLDDLDLLRSGIPFLHDFEAPLLVGGTAAPGELAILEPEGVPIAEVQCAAYGSGSDLRVVRISRWLATRPERPFESLHRPVEGVEPAECTIVIDEGTEPSRIRAELGRQGASSALLLLAAAVERDGQSDPRAVERVRAVRQKLRSFPDELRDRVRLVILPIADDHPYFESRLTACAAAYAHGHDVFDLRSEPVESGLHRGGSVVFFTGLSGSGKSTLARALRNRLLEGTDREVTLLDGDVVRRHLSAGLGFGAADRDTNIRRIGWVAARIAEHGGLAIASPIAPYAATREDVRSMICAAGGRFVLIHVSTPLAECERRDRKGLYARARRGEIADFTGISAPYEEPKNSDLRLDTTGTAVDALTNRILSFGVEEGLWSRPLDSRS